MVQVHDTVPHTVNIVTAGNPPGQPVEVALEAGKTVSFMMPEKLYMTPMPFLNGGTHTTGQRLELPGRSDRAAIGDQSGCVAGVQQPDPW